MMKILNAISREEEAMLPEFKNHDEARAFFKDKYGDRFQLKYSDVIDGKKIYFYVLILNEQAYREGRELLEEKGFMPFDEKFFFSTQDIEIWADGGIHILH